MKILGWCTSISGSVFAAKYISILTIDSFFIEGNLFKISSYRFTLRRIDSAPKPTKATLERQLDAIKSAPKAYPIQCESTSLKKGSKSQICLSIRRSLSKKCVFKLIQNKRLKVLFTWKGLLEYGKEAAETRASK